VALTTVCLLFGYAPVMSAPSQFMRFAWQPVDKHFIAFTAAVVAVHIAITVGCLSVCLFACLSVKHNA